MMDLAVRDIRNDLSRFLLTAAGLGMLMSVVLAMTGIYNGMVVDATVLPDTYGGDLWVVQKGTQGPFAESSRVPALLADRIRAVPGVERTRSYMTLNVQHELGDGETLRFMLAGLSWPDDLGNSLPLAQGRALRQPHYELVADRALGLPVGTSLRLGRDDYTIVGITSGMVSSSGDPLVFASVSDALRIQNDLASEALRLERESRVSRVRRSEYGRDPANLARAGSAAPLPVTSPPPVTAILVDVAAGGDVEAVKASLLGWPDISVYTIDEQRELLVRGVIDRARRQIGLFRALLVLISAIVMGLIVYTMTLDKMLSLSLLKLLGAKQRVILRLILEESLLLGISAYLVALLIGELAFDLFPRRVLVQDLDRLALLGVILGLSVAAGMVGLRKALAANPNEVLAS
ncbi:MAG: ABC transporter permease [Planctomycetota bacterium]|nr:ABC transporter permease [Planctomycetota bacterium]